MALSVADQGLASGANFAAALALARWLPPADYGAYTLGYSVLLFGAGLHNALVLEPMGYVGACRYAGRLPAYLGLTLWMHILLSAAVSAATLGMAGVLACFGSRLAGTVICLALVSPAILLAWLFRRACYLAMRPGLAVAGSLMYAALLAAGLAAGWRGGCLSAPAVFAWMGAAALAMFLAFSGRLGLRLRHLTAPRTPAAVIGAAKRHWAFGRWSLGKTALYWFSSLIYLPVVGALAGLESVASYRAAENLMSPMSQILTASGLLLFPWLARERQVKGSAYLRRAAAGIGLTACLVAAAYGIAVIAGGRWLLRTVYGDDRYAGSFCLAPFLAAGLVFRAAADTGAGLAARAAGRPDIELRAAAASAAVTLGAGLALVKAFGITGAAAGYALSAAAGAAVAVIAFCARPGAQR